MDEEHLAAHDQEINEVEVFNEESTPGRGEERVMHGIGYEHNLAAEH